MDVATEFMQMLQINEPCVLLVDANKIDINALASQHFPNLRENVLLLAVDGTPDVKKTDVKTLRAALAELERT